MEQGSVDTEAGESVKIHDTAKGSDGHGRKYETGNAPRRPNEGNGCLACLAGFFSSRQLANKDNGYKSSVYELCVYILFLVTISVAAFGLRSFNGYYFNKVMTDLFVDAEFDPPKDSATFRTSVDMNDFWKFAETVMLHGLYHSEWKQRALKDERKAFQHGIRNLNPENLQIGRPRLKQVRILPSPCPAQDTLRMLSRMACYLSYEKDKEDNSSLIKSRDKEQSWIEQSILDEPEGVFYWGRHRSYSSGGVHILLGTTEDETIQLVNQLKIWQWITRATRAVILDFIVYNHNINLFAVVRFVWEFHPTGGMTTSWDIHTLELDRYNTAFDYIILGFEIAFCVFTLYYFLQEMGEICKLGVRKYATDLWSWIDLSILTISCLCIAFSVYRYLIIKNKIDSLFQDPNKFTYFEYFGYWESQFNNAKGVCVFLAWIKIFKYVSFSKTMGQISNTIAKCYNDLTGFFAMFSLVYFAFVLLGHFLFCSQVRDFRSIMSSILTLLRFILGDFNFEELTAANRILGPIFFFAYTIFVVFILMNMFLAIINETYEEVLVEIVEKKKSFRLSHFLRSGYRNFRSTLSSRQHRKPAHLLPNINGTISHTELKDNLLRANFTDLEVETFLARHELDEDHIWDENDIQVILSHLERESYDDRENQIRFSQLDEGIEDEYPVDFNMPHEDLQELNQRIDTLENVISNVQRSVGHISSRLDAM